MTLSKWERNGWLKQLTPRRAEIRDLIKLVERDLADSLAEGISADWQLSIAYNAALQVANGALAAEGYRVASDPDHHHAIQSLRETIGVDKGVVEALEAFRKKRNRSGYEKIGLISETDARAMRDLAKKLFNALLSWLKEHHPDLTP
jgi:hypothetical protein